jgi:mannonate dehydratase
VKLGVSHRKEEQLNDRHFSYLRQMGVEQVEVRISRRNADSARLQEIKKQVESAGLGLFEIMLHDLYNFPARALGLPEQKEETAEFIRFLENLGRIGIGNTTYAWCSGGTYSTGETISRGCSARDFRLEKALHAPAAYPHSYTEDEMWASYERFIEEVLPVAEKARVRLQLHPNDPPVSHGGIARIFSSTGAFRRAMTIAGHSPYSAILFCVGTWAEMTGPDGTGEDVAGALSEFVRAGHVHQVHFRNVSSPLPDFHETFIENGYVDLPRVMQVLADSGFDGMIVPDHVPNGGTSDAGAYGTEAYLLGYLRSMIRTAKAAANR